MRGLERLSAAEAVRRIAAREITSVALLEACLNRIREREPQVQAWACFDRDAALARAREVDRAGARGLLAGVPIAVKDVIDTADLPTQYNSPIYRDHRPRADAACVALARREGAIVLGKTVTTEFASRTPGPTRNPHDLAHTPGGSSSGTAAAVADFMVPFGFGTQTGVIGDSNRGQTTFFGICISSGGRNRGLSPIAFWWSVPYCSIACLLRCHVPADPLCPNSTWRSASVGGALRRNSLPRSTPRCTAGRSFTNVRQRETFG